MFAQGTTTVKASAEGAVALGELQKAKAPRLLRGSELFVLICFLLGVRFYWDDKKILLGFQLFFGWFSFCVCVFFFLLGFSFLVFFEFSDVFWLSWLMPKEFA